MINIEVQIENENLEANYEENFVKIAKNVFQKAEEILPVLNYPEGTNVNSEVFLCVTSNESIQKINKEQRDVDCATDVLSFPLLEHKDGIGKITKYDINPETGSIMLGDLLISSDKVIEQAKEYGHSEERELAFLLCHGLLHLRGYDHIENEDEIVMKAKAYEILTAAGYERV